MSSDQRTDLPVPPQDWEKCLLRDRLLLRSGSTPLRSLFERYYLNGDIPWVKTLDMNEGYIISTEEKITKAGLRESSCQVLPEKTVLIAMYGGWLQIGRAAILGISAATNQAICSLTPIDESIDPDFLLRFLQAYRFRWKAVAGSTRKDPNITKDDVASFEIALPSLTAQRKIARILTTLDNLIEKTESLIAKYQAIKQGMMHDLFTRGVDEHGHLRPPYEEAPELYKQSELGWIPKEWEVCRLDDVAVRGSGHTPNKLIASYWNGGVKWVSLADSDKLDQLFITETDKKISELGLANSSAVRHRAGTVVLSRDAGIGKSAIISESMAVSQHFIAWYCGPRLINYSLYYWLQHEKPRFEAIAMGSTIMTIGLSFFKRLQIAVSPKLEQKFGTDALLAIEHRLFGLAEELAKYKQQKTGLMQDLLTGKVRVTVDEAEEVAL